MNETFQRLVKLLIKQSLPVQVCIGTVETVDVEKQTCTVLREDAPKLFGVRLNAVVSEYADRLILKPKEGSLVLCSLIENDVNEAYLLACSKLEEISLNIGEQSLLINKDGFIFNTGELGGLIKIEELKTQLEKLTARVDTIFDGFSKLVPDAPQAGSVGLTNGLKAITTPAKENFGSIEDVKVKH